MRPCGSEVAGDAAATAELTGCACGDSIGVLAFPEIASPATADGVSAAGPLADAGSRLACGSDVTPPDAADGTDGL